MRYLRGETLGLFCGELGIQPSSRILIAPSRHGLLVWDLSAGVEFNLSGDALAAEQKPAPGSFHAIFHEPDRALLVRLSDPDLMPWSEERETLLSELRYRNLSHTVRPRYPLRAMLASLTAHLLLRFNPLRLFRHPGYPSH